MTGAGALSLHEAAWRVHRDIKGVHSDAHALLNAGLPVKTGDGAITRLRTRRLEIAFKNKKQIRIHCSLQPLTE